ncbi:hypothetical protein [Vibrio cholerae]|uniref:hypothetical protein n=1 Tax=Vibrio cholerae TaxID=666 RepID=UPI000BA91D06|nr:hypothetical protein [Vibrio cholerae]PAR93876.1 hypothetical protein CGT82_10540 [Vibrio cholerae]
MKTIKLIGLLALIASPFASANTPITFPGDSGSVPDAPIIFPTSKTPITFYDGYTIENGIFRSEVNSCVVDLANPEYEAKLTWEGVTPKLVILSNTNFIACRAHRPTKVEIDLTQFVNNIPTHILEHIELANNVAILRIR